MPLDPDTYTHRTGAPLPRRPRGSRTHTEYGTNLPVLRSRFGFDFINIIGMKVPQSLWQDARVASAPSDSASISFSEHFKPGVQTLDGKHWPGISESATKFPMTTLDWSDCANHVLFSSFYEQICCVTCFQINTQNNKATLFSDSE